MQDSHENKKKSITAKNIWNRKSFQNIDKVKYNG